MSQAQLLPTVPPFQFKDFPIRTHVEDDQLWFAAKDVCVALGISWTGHSLSAIPDDWQRVVKLTTLRRGAQGLRVISEPAVYKLAFRSNKPEADAFTNWIASEVVPAIRKTGKYEDTPKKKALGRGIKALPEAAPALPPAEENTKFLPIKFEEYERDIIDIERKIERLCELMSIFARPGGMLTSDYNRNKPLIDAVQPCISAAKNAVGTGYYMMQTARKIYGAMR